MALSAPSRGAVEPAPARTARRTPFNVLSAGHLVMIVAGLTGMLLTFALLRNADHRVEVAVAAHDVRTGEVVDADAIRYERVRMDRDLLDTALRPDDVRELDGAVATGPIAAGELISRSDLRASATGSELRAVSVPVERARAVDGDLETGDRVDVILVGDQEVVTIVAGAEVLEVNVPEGSSFGDVDDTITLTLAVDAREAELLAAAVTDGDFLIARSTGADPADGTAPVPVNGLSPSSSGP